MKNWRIKVIDDKHCTERSLPYTLSEADAKELAGILDEMIKGVTHEVYEEDVQIVALKLPKRKGRAGKTGGGG